MNRGLEYCSIRGIANREVRRPLLAQVMKRAAETHPTPPAMKAAIVRLNVGGRLFSTSRETLTKCAYFDPFLAGRILHATDDRGALFIDRSPELFRILLQYMRASTVPPQSALRTLKYDLLAECQFFRLPSLIDYFWG